MGNLRKGYILIKAEPNVGFDNSNLDNLKLFFHNHYYKNLDLINDNNNVKKY